MTSSATATAESEALDETVASLVSAGAPGAVAYTRKDGTHRHAAAGYANVSNREPATVRHRFRIASNTKPFTAVVVLQLVAENRLSLDAPVARWLPRIPRDITVRQLLNHTSGLYDPTAEKAFWSRYLAGDRDYVHRPHDIVRTALTHPRTTGYSNTNYLVAGLLIEKVTRRSAVAELYRRIIVPLHLVDTSFPVTDPRIHGGHLHGYALDGRTDMTVFSPSYDWTAGALISTVDDLARFHGALLDGTLLAPAQLTELKRTVTVEGVPRGLGVDQVPVFCADGSTRTVWATSGGGPGYNSYALTTDDATRQLVVAINVYDIAEELDGRSPIPDGTGEALLPAIRSTFCAP